MKSVTTAMVGVIVFCSATMHSVLVCAQQDAKAAPHVRSLQLVELDKKIYNARANALQSGERRIVGAVIRADRIRDKKVSIGPNWMTADFKISRPAQFSSLNICTDFSDINAQYRRTSLLSSQESSGQIELRIDTTGSDELFDKPGTFIAYPALVSSNVSDACGAGEPPYDASTGTTPSIFPAQIGHEPLQVNEEKILAVQVNSGGGQAYATLLDEQDAPVGDAIFCRESSVQNGLYDQVCEIQLPANFESPALIRLDVQQPGYASDFVRILAWFDQIGQVN